VSYIHDLLAETRGGNQEAAQELVDFVEHVLGDPKRLVGSAFGLTHRGGDKRKPERAARNAILRERSRRLAPDLLTEQRARAIESDLDLLRKIKETGLKMPGRRQLRNIIGSRAADLD
jgi:hypothetical protein